jgi:hypothetical protein
MIKWTKEFDYSKPAKIYSTFDVVKYLMKDEETRGTVETLESQVRLLADLVAVLVTKLEGDDQRKIVKQFSYCFKELEEL